MYYKAYWFVIFFNFIKKINKTNSTENFCKNKIHLLKSEQ